MHVINTYMLSQNTENAHMREANGIQRFYNAINHKEVAAFALGRGHDVIEVLTRWSKCNNWNMYYASVEIYKDERSSKSNIKIEGRPL